MMTVYNGTIEEKKDRMTRWWKGESLGRPALSLIAPDSAYDVEYSHLIPEGVYNAEYTTKSLDYRLAREHERVYGKIYYGDAIPYCTTDICACVLATFLGCRATEGEDSVWVEHDFENDDPMPIAIDREGFFYKFYWEMQNKLLELYGDAACRFTDLVEGIDIYAAMRGTQNTLLDIYDKPDQLLSTIHKIDEAYMEVYDEMYERIKDHRGGSDFWIWGPGKTAKIQCDIAAMLSPDMFKTFSMPTLKKLSDYMDSSIYHMDGPDATCHLDHILTLENLDVIQWEPGAFHHSTNTSIDHEMWYDMYRKIIRSGKRIMLHHMNTAEKYQRMIEAFGADIDKFYFASNVDSTEEAEKILNLFKGKI